MATVDDVSGVSTRFDPDQLIVVSDAIFTRPSPDQGFFQPLCVDEGSTVQWLPQTNSDASQTMVPFLGIDNAVPEGTFLDDHLQLRLIAVQSPMGSGFYSLWKDGFPPKFPHSSCDCDNKEQNRSDEKPNCDGIGEQDVLSLPPGHDHFNMGFAHGLGDWNIRYEVSGTKPKGSELKTQFAIHYRVQSP